MPTSEAKLTAAAPRWSRLDWDLTETILSRLPLRSIVVSGAVCRQWRSVITDRFFSARRGHPRPWFFLYGRHNLLATKNQAFAFDPVAGEWFLLPSPPTDHGDFLFGSGGFRFAATSSSTRFSYAPLLRGPWRLTPQLYFSRCNPLIGVCSDLSNGGEGPRFVVAGGASFVGGLVDIEDRLAVEVYDPTADAWELCAPMPAEFRHGNSSQWLTSAMIRGVFFVYGIYSGAVASFDVERRAWSSVRSLRPPGTLLAFLLAAGDRLVIAGLFAAADAPPRFAIFDVDHGTLESVEVGAMPRDLLACLFDSDDDDTRFSSLKCVGVNGLVYVFNEDRHKGYPACVCEISTDGGRGATCTWRKVPQLPLQINGFHKVVAFCSIVPLDAVVGPAAGLGL